MSQVDVNIPAELQPRVGTLLDAFRLFLIEHRSGSVRTALKTGSGHVTPWWIYLQISTEAPSRSVVQYGETTFQGVNPVPHLWVRGKRGWIDDGAALLRAFMQRMLRRHVATLSPPSMPLRPPMPTRAPPRWSTPERAPQFDNHLPVPNASGAAPHGRTGELIVLADFDGAAYGSEYMQLRKGDIVEKRVSPANVPPEGWSFGWHREGDRDGWYPGHYAQE